MDRRRFFAERKENAELSPDWYYRAVNLDGTQDLVDSGLQMFGSSLTQWTLFYYIDDFPASETRTANNERYSRLRAVNMVADLAMVH